MIARICLPKPLHLLPMSRKIDVDLDSRVPDLLLRAVREDACWDRLNADPSALLAETGLVPEDFDIGALCNRSPRAPGRRESRLEVFAPAMSGARNASSTTRAVSIRQCRRRRTG